MTKPAMNMQERTGKRGTKLDLLKSSLSSDVVAGQILIFLSRQDILNCLDVDELCRQYHLTTYYCIDHGSRLESQTELRQEREGVEDNEEAEEYAEEEGIAVTRTYLECIDCVEEEYNRFRCPQCEDFSEWGDINRCDCCGNECCETCERIEIKCCGSCEEEYCTSCGEFAWCDHCGSDYCCECSKANFCKKCGEALGCSGCVYENGSFVCGKCKEAFCSGCQDHFDCEICSSSFCKSCKKSYYCDFCNDSHCREHGEPFDCEECGATFCDDSLVFQCSECETTTCRYQCTKAYACTDCKKEICADCQDIFQQCCCETKGKYVLIATSD